MTSSVIPQLIRKDLRLSRLHIGFTVGAGILALALLQRGGEVWMVLGSTWYFVAIIILACMVPIGLIVNERKKQTLAFVMSLPVSSTEYTIAKLVATWVTFLGPWLLLLAVAFTLVVTRHLIPLGAIPIMLILALLPVVGFSLILSVALVSESEGWAMAATVICNSSYGLAWYLFSKASSLTVNWNSPVAIWDGAVLRILSVEVGFVILAMGLTLFFQSRKRDFI